MKGIPILKRRGHTLPIGQMHGLVDHNPQFHVDLPLLIQDSLFHAGAVFPDQALVKSAKVFPGKSKSRAFLLLKIL
jgi:hypothetical protein